MCVCVFVCVSLCCFHVFLFLHLDLVLLLLAMCSWVLFGLAGSRNWHRLALGTCATFSSLDLAFFSHRNKETNKNKSGEHVLLINH